MLKDLNDEIFAGDLSVEVTDERGLLLWVIVVAGVEGATAANPAQA